jgi:hypothetical protein
VLASAEGNLAQACLLRLGQRSANDGEGFALNVVLGDDEVGLLKVLGRELVERDELLDFDGVLGGHAQIGDFGRLDDDVLVLAVFVALYDLILLDRRSGFARGLFEGGGQDLLVAHALAGGAADLVEADLALGFSGDEQLDAEGDERNLDVAGPVRTRQRTPRRQIHQMIEIPERAVKM